MSDTWGPVFNGLAVAFFTPGWFLVLVNPPVFAIPGIGDTRASYRTLAPLLAARNCTVYLMDLRGHGESDSTFASYRKTPQCGC